MNPAIPKVSVLIPTYNCASYLDEAIQSVLSQTYSNYELVILDNASKDGTAELVQKYVGDERVRYYKNDHTISLVDNWNKCLEYVRGEYVKYLCADDKFHPQMLEKFVAAMDEYPTVSLVAAYKRYFGSENRDIIMPFKGLVPGQEIINYTLGLHDFLGDPTVVMFRSANLKLGGFTNKILWLTDWEMWIRHLNVGDAYIIPEVLTYIRKHEGQATKSVIMRNFIDHFDEYTFFKMIEENNHKLDLSKVNLQKMIKMKARACATQVMYKSIPQLYRKDVRQSFMKALKIAYKEKVIISSLIVSLRKKFKRA